MSFRCMDVMNLFPAASIQLLGGADGLDRVVRWVYVAEATDSILYSLSWLSGNELVIITGSNISGDPDAVIMEFIKSCAKKQVSGIVINTGRYIPKVPEDAVQLADRLKLPLFVIPWETRLVEFTKDICTAIIDQAVENESANTLADSLLFGRTPLTENERLSLAAFGFERAPGYLVVVFRPEKTEATVGQSGAELRAYLADSVRARFEREHRQALVTGLSESVVAIVKSAEGGDCYRGMLGEIAGYIHKRFPAYTLRIGVGKVCRSLAEIPRCYHMAQQAIHVRRMNAQDPVACFEDIGIYSLLLSIEDNEVLRNYYRDLFAPLLDYDRSNGTSLMHTLAAYIDHDTRLAATAKALFIHENTLKYRLNKIKTLLGMEIGQLEEQCRISIGLKIGRMLGEDLQGS